MPASVGQSGRPVVLVGEPPVMVPRGGSPQVVEITSAAQARLRLPILNQTRSGATIEAVQIDTPQIVALNPIAVVLFAGAAEESAQIPEEKLTYHLQSFARAVAATGSRVFVIPSSDALGIEMASTLQIAAGGAGPQTVYVDLGGRLTGRPYDAAFEKVEQNLAQAVAAPPVVATPTPTPTPTLVRVPDVTTGAAELSLPPVIVPAEIPVPGENSETTGGRVRAVGPNATPAVIEMTPPAPVKQFSPRKPALNRPGQKKQPELAR